MNQLDNQSIVIEGGSTVAQNGTRDDLDVQYAEHIQGGNNGLDAPLIGHYNLKTAKKH